MTNPNYQRDADSKFDQQPEDTLILSKAVLVLSHALDNFVGACIDESGQAKAPDRTALMKARPMLPPACKHALTKKV